MYANLFVIMFALPIIGYCFVLLSIIERSGSVIFRFSIHLLSQKSKLSTGQLQQACKYFTAFLINL